MDAINVKTNLKSTTISSSWITRKYKHYNIWLASKNRHFRKGISWSNSIWRRTRNSKHNWRRTSKSHRDSGKIRKVWIISNH